ncbi:MAG TPA: hypothetical protein VF346_11590 [Bacteroidales bacterium]
MIYDYIVIGSGFGGSVAGLRLIEGVGSSGIGRYHGKKSFDTFSNLRSVLVKSNLLDIPIRYPPYSKLKTKIIGFFMR